MICPCVFSTDVGPKQRVWSVCFDAEFQLNNLTYEGTIRCVADGAPELARGNEFLMLKDATQFNTTSVEGVLARGIILG